MQFTNTGATDHYLLLHLCYKSSGGQLMPWDSYTTAVPMVLPPSKIVTATVPATVSLAADTWQVGPCFTFNVDTNGQTRETGWIMVVN
jgi:hypothetical protein